MKTQYWVRRSAAVICLAATLQFNCGRAQDQPKAPASTPAAQPAAEGGSGSPYQLEIVQGTFVRNKKVMEATLANAVDALRDFWPGVNIVLAPEVSKLKVGDLKLRSAGELGEALEALRVASGYRFDYRQGVPHVGGTTVDPATGLPGQPAGEPTLYVLDLGIDSQRNPLERARRMVDVFNMSGYFEQLKKHDQDEVNRTLEEVEHTVFTTLASLKEGGVAENEMPHFQFHSGTGLLIVTGPPDAIEVARKVVSALTGQPSGDALALMGSAGPYANQRAAAQERFANQYAPRTGGGFGGGGSGMGGGFGGGTGGGGMGGARMGGGTGASQQQSGPPSDPATTQPKR